MQRCRPCLSLVALALLAGCSAFDVVNALTPDDGYTVQRDIAYGAGERQRLDLYVPDKATADSPVVVFFYGGNWQSGSKADYAFVGQAFSSHGYVTAIPDYRLYPAARYPAFLEDSAAAVARVRELRAGSAERAEPLYLVGHSAGAYNVATLTLDERWLARAGAPVCASVAAAVGLAGPYDFLPLTDPDLMAIFGPEESRPATQPINHVSGAAPPMFLATGADDTTVRPGNSARLAERIAEKDGSVELHVYDGIGHVGLVAALAKPLRGLAPVLGDTVRFLRRHPRDAGGSCGKTATHPSRREK